MRTTNLNLTTVSCMQQHGRDHFISMIFHHKAMAFALLVIQALNITVPAPCCDFGP